MIDPDIVKALRESLNESQAVFGARFGVGQTAVHYWETRGVKSSLAEHAIQAIIKKAGPPSKKGGRRSGKALAATT